MQFPIPPLECLFQKFNGIEQVVSQRSDGAGARHGAQIGNEFLDACLGIGVKIVMLFYDIGVSLAEGEDLQLEAPAAGFTHHGAQQVWHDAGVAIADVALAIGGQTRPLKVPRGVQANAGDASQQGAGHCNGIEETFSRDFRGTDEVPIRAL